MGTRARWTMVLFMHGCEWNREWVRLYWGVQVHGVRGSEGPFAHVMCHSCAMVRGWLIA